MAMPPLSRAMRRLKLNDLQVLSAVVASGSMAKAAARLAMSQPSVSASVAHLESVVGVRLLDRSARGVAPTRYGDALLARARVVFDELGDAMRELDFLADPTRGEVTLACGDTLAAGLVPAAIAKLSLEHRGIVVNVVQAGADAPGFRELRERKVDLALARIAGPLSEPDLEAEMLFEDPHRIVVGTRSRWARAKRVELSQLAREAWTFPSGPVMRGLIADAFRAHGLETPRDAVNASSILLRNRLLATGRFVTVLPDSVLRYNAKQWSLTALPVDLRVTPRSVAMVTLRNRTVGPVVQVFAQAVRDAARAMAPPPAAPRRAARRRA